MKNSCLWCIVVFLLSIKIIAGVPQLLEKNMNRPMNQTRKDSFLVDCFMFSGENHLMDLKLKSMSSFVTYFVVFEPEVTDAGTKREASFNISNFMAYAHQILYFPISNVPNVVS